MGCYTNWVPRPKVQELASVEVGRAQRIEQVNAANTAIARARIRSYQNRIANVARNQFLLASERADARALTGVTQQINQEAAGIFPRYVLQPTAPFPQNALSHRRYPGGAVDIYNAIQQYPRRPGGCVCRPGGDNPVSDFLEWASETADQTSEAVSEFWEEAADVFGTISPDSELWSWLCDTTSAQYEAALQWLGSQACAFLDTLGLKDIFAALYIWKENVKALNRPAEFFTNLIFVSVEWLLAVAKTCHLGMAARAQACAMRDLAAIVATIGAVAQIPSLVAAAADMGISAATAASMQAIGNSCKIVYGAICINEWPSVLDMTSLVMSLIGFFDVASMAPEAPAWLITAVERVKELRDQYNSIITTGQQVGDLSGEIMDWDQAAVSFIEEENIQFDAAGSPLVPLFENAPGAGMTKAKIKLPLGNYILDESLISNFITISPLTGTLFAPGLTAAREQKQALVEGGYDYDKILQEKGSRDLPGGGALLGVAAVAGAFVVGAN